MIGHLPQPVTVDGGSRIVGFDFCLIYNGWLRIGNDYPETLNTIHGADWKDRFS
jgi:hypothetical protein